MAVTVVQTASAVNNGTGPAPVIFASPPTAGNLLLFLAGSGDTTIGVVASGPGLVLLNTGLGNIVGGSLYYRRVQSGDSAQWGFGLAGEYVSVVAWELAGVTGSAVFLDAAPAWHTGATSPAADGQPAVTPSAAATGGLALSLLVTNASVTATSSSPWSNPVSAVPASFDSVYGYRAAATPSSAMTANWSLSATTNWIGAIVVVLAATGVAAPTAGAGPAQYAQALTGTVLPGTATTAPGHTASYAWQALTGGAPAITSGASSLSGTIASVGAPHALTAYDYQLTVTQDDGQEAVATVAVTVAPPPVFQATGTLVTITPVQFQSATVASGNTVTVNVSTTAGHTLVAAVRAFWGGVTPITITSLTDSAGNNWTYPSTGSSQNPPASGAFNSLQGYYSLTAVGYVTPAAHVTSVTVVLSQNVQGASLYITEFSGVPASSGADGSAAAAPEVFDVAVTASCTTGASADCVVAVSMAQFQFTSVSPGSYTLSADGYAAYAAVTGPAQQSVTFTGGFVRSIDSWAILAVGNPALLGQGWYGEFPAKHATGGNWT